MNSKTVKNENRIHPRVGTDFETEIILAKGQHLKVTTANISLAGLMVNATQKDFEAILNHRNSIKLDEPVEVDLQFKLPSTNGTPLVISSHCRTVYVRRISQNKYYVGFKFLKIPQRFETAIETFIQNNIDSVLPVNKEA